MQLSKQNLTKAFKSVSALTQTDFRGNCSGLVRRFTRNEDGTFVTIFGVSAVALFLTIGIAVDYTQISRAETIVNNSLDAAVLAAGNELVEGAKADSKLRSLFEDHLYANLGGHPELLNAVSIQEFFADEKTGEVRATLSTPVQMAFMGLIGYQKVPVKSATEARFSTNPVEISMVLDVTGSMNSNGKLGSLKLAAADAVDILLPAGKNNDQVRLGLVPYSAGVRLNSNLAEKASGQTFSSCLTERKVNPYNDVSYVSEPVGADNRAACSNSKVLPLTSNNKKLKDEINALVANGYTAGHLGISWGYYMLSEKWQNLWPNTSKPADYGGKTKKIAILMTDGSFNTYFQGIKGSPFDTNQTIANSNIGAKSLCNEMKKSKKGGDGIEVYSIAFNAPADAKQTLQACASTNTPKTTFYYDANSEEELRTAFREIAKSIKTLRLTR